MDRVLFSSHTDMWETPQDLFDELNKEFHFTLDVCATAQNAKCERFYSPVCNGLLQPWWGETAWCNPPYGREVGDWVRKASKSAAEGSTVVMLLPARTDTKWFHDYIYQNPFVEVRFLKGRLKFGGAKNSAPFPSMVVIFRDSCAGCRWKERPQKCSCCKRNKYIKDCYEDRGRDD